MCSVWSRHGLGGTHPVLGPWSTAQPAPVGFPRLVRALGPKELIKPSGNSPLTGQCGPRAHGTPAGRAWAQGFLRMLAVRARPTADTPGGLGCPPTHTQLPRLEPSAPQDGQAQGSAPYSGQPCARPRRWRAPARPRALPSKHSGRAPPPRPRRPFPRYPPRAHAGLRGRPRPGPAQALRYQ